VNFFLRIEQSGVGANQQGSRLVIGKSHLSPQMFYNVVVINQSEIKLESNIVYIVITGLL
jgi:hypothetical protein